MKCYSFQALFAFAQGQCFVKRNIFLKKFHALSNLDLGEINLSKIFQLMNDRVLLHVPVFVVESGKKNLEHEVYIALCLGVFSYTNIYILIHSL